MSFLRYITWAVVLFALPLSALAATSQTLTFPAIPVRETTASSFSLAATASSGLAVSYQVVGGSGVVSVTGSTVTLSGQAGAYSIRAMQAGNGTYDAATPVIVTSSVRSGAGFQMIFSGPKPGHAGGIKTDGTLWMWGDNGSSQLGNGNTVPQPVPVQIGIATDWQSGALGNNHTLVIKTDGTLWGFGFNGSSGRIGDGSTSTRSAPVRIGTATDWKRVAGGGSHSAGVRQDGSLWAWGDNTNGQLGQGATGGTQTTPLRVGTASDWTAVGCGLEFVIALKSNGTLWAWGQNTSGQLGDGTTTGHTTPAQIGAATDWKTLRVGYNHALATKNDGTFWGWGSNVYGNLAIGSTGVVVMVPTQSLGSITNWTDLSAGFYSTVAVRADGTLWASGSGGARSIGDGTFLTRTSLVQIGTDTDWRHVGSSEGRYAVKTDGSLWVWSDADGSLGSGAATGLAPRALQPSTPSLGAVRSAAAGLYHTLAVREDGTLWSWGSNFQSQLGGGTYRKAPEQVGTATNWATVAAGQSHSLAVKNDGTLWGFGSNGSGRLGDGTTSSRSTPGQCGTDSDWQTAAAGSTHSLGLKTNGTLWAWGANTNGQLGDGSNTQRNSPVQVGSSTWRAIACGIGFSLGIRSDGTLWTWGSNSLNQLGDGSAIDRNAPVQIGSDTTWTKVASGRYHSLALKANSTLWAWGNNLDGQLGDATTTSRSVPVQIGTDTDWSDISASLTHSAALKSNGTLWSWGTNNNAQLGDGTAVARRTSPAQTGNFNQWKALPFNSSYSTCILALTQGNLLCASGENGTGMLAAAGYDQTVPQRSLPAPTEQTLTFPAVISPAVGASVTLTATTASGLSPSYAVTGPATLSGSTLTRTGAGTIRVIAYGAADASWQPAPMVLQTLETPAPSADPALASLSVSAAQLLPAFDPAILTYAATVPHSSTTLSLLATTAHPGATMTWNDGLPLASGVASAPYSLSVGANFLALRVTAEDQATFRDYTLTLTRQSAYQTWAATNLGSSNATMTADADSDGQANLIEYAFGTAPQTAGNSPVLQDTATVGPDKFLRLTVPKNANAPDVTFTVQATSDLSNSASWSSAGLVIQANTSTQLMVRDSVPVAAGVRRFMRVRVAQVP